MRLNCQKCGLFLGKMEKGALRKGAVLLCDHCWRKAEAAMNMADMVSKGTPEFLNDLFKEMDGKKYDG